MFFVKHIRYLFHPYLLGLIILLGQAKMGVSQSYTTYPELEKRANQILVQDADQLMIAVDHWVDSLALKPDSATWMYFMLYKAEALTTLSEYTSAFQLIELVQKKALATNAITIDPHLYFRILTLEASCHMLCGQRTVALDTLQVALKIAEDHKLYEDEVVANLLIAESLRPTGGFNRATSYLKRAEELCFKHDLSARIKARVYDRYAACSTVVEITEDCATKAIGYAREVNDRSILGSAHLTLGVFVPHSFEVKDSLFQIGAHHFRALGDRRNLGLAYLDISRNFLGMEDYKKGLVYADSLGALLIGNDWPYLKDSYYAMKVHAFKALGEKDSIIVYLDRAYNEIKNRSVKQDFETLYFAEKKYQDELRAATIREQDYELANSAQRFRLIAIFLVIAAIFVVGLFYFLIRLRRSKREIENKQTEIASINTNLEASLEENKILLYETHHRVKNNLQVVSSLLELQSESANNALLENALVGAQNRIGAMAFVHELLYKQDDVKNVDIAKYIKAMSSQIAAFYGDSEELSVIVNCNNIQFPLHRAIHLGIFINELLTNSHKYARQKDKPLEIHIELIEKNNMNQLTYRDNGPGLPRGLDSGKVGSIGLYLLKSMAKQLRGKLIYKQESGASFEILFKK